MFKYNPFMLGSLVISALISIYIGFVAFEPADAINIIRYGGYWLILTAFSLLLFNLYQRTSAARQELLQNSRGWIGPGCYILICSAITLMLQPDAYKVVMDEPVLAATSMQMHEEKEVLTVARGYEINGVFYLLGGYVDKRPYLFPFLTSLLHDLTGYRPMQGVVLNGLLTPVFLTLLFIVGRLVGRKWGGYLAVGLMVTVPLLAMNANSGGFDLLNIVMLLGATLAGYSYLHAPNVLRMNTLILMGILLAQSRYESALYVAVVGLVVGFGWLKRKEIELSWVAILAPLLLISFPLQRTIMDAYKGFWQLEEGMTSPFGLQYIVPNLQDAAAYFFANNLDQPNSFFVSVLFVAALVVFPIQMLRRRLSVRLLHAGSFVFIVFTLGILANFALLMSYHWGQINDIQATRLALPFILFQVVLIVTVAGALRMDRVLGPVLATLTLLFFVTITRPLCARSDFLQWGASQQAVQWIHQKTTELKGQSVLVITGLPLTPIINQVSGLFSEDAIEHKERIDLHQRLGTFSEIFVVTLVPTERANLEGSKMYKHALEMNAGLDEAFSMELVEEEQINAAIHIRLSRITGVHLEESERLVFDSDRSPALSASLAGSNKEELLQSFVLSLP